MTDRGRGEGPEARDRAGAAAEGAPVAPGDLQFDLAWAELRTGGRARAKRPHRDDEPVFEDPNDR